MKKIGFDIQETITPRKYKYLHEELRMKIEVFNRDTKKKESTEKKKYAAKNELIINDKVYFLCKLENHDIEIVVQTPVTYCMYKILIQKRKKKMQKKDEQLILRLLPHIFNNNTYRQEWKKVFDMFSKKEKKRFLNNLENIIELCE